MPRGDKTCLTGPARAVLLPLRWEVLNEWGDKTCSIGPAHAVLLPCTVGGEDWHWEIRLVRLGQLVQFQYQPSPFNKNVCANCRVLSDTCRH